MRSNNASSPFTACSAPNLRLVAGAAWLTLQLRAHGTLTTAGVSIAVLVRGLFETHLTVTDLDRSVTFYREVVGLPVALEVPERGAAFHWIGQPGQAMLGLWSIGSAPVGMQLHIAFEMSLADVLAAPEQLIARSIQPLSFFAEPADEPSVIGWMPAAAVYFRDPDGHLLEYLAMLEGAARPELGIVPWSRRDE
jgi:lactoylglutathione lyase